MSLGRFILAALVGAAATIWLLFFAATFDRRYDSTGVIFWDGVIYGNFSLGYLAALYLPPLTMAACSFFALRRPKG